MQGKMKFKKSYGPDNAIIIDEFAPQLGKHAKTLAKDSHRIALDSKLASSSLDFASFYNVQENLFPGYAFLQGIAQNALISAGVETLSDEMTSKFAEIIYQGTADDESKANDKIAELTADLDTFHVRKVFREAAEYTGYYGGCLVAVNVGNLKPNQKDTPLYLDKTTFKQGSLKSFVAMDPINCYPGFYNSTDPTSTDYFNPKTWVVLNQTIHISRLLHFSGKKAPLLYKPTYNFFGIGLAQLAWEYVLDFEKNKQSASDLLNKFSMTVIKSNLSGALAGEGTADFDARLVYFVEKQNNNGIMAIDKEQEDIMKLDTSLSGVTEIVRQALELISAVFGIPAVKLLGISPAGFNATGLSDLKNYYARVRTLQEKQFSDNLHRVLEILQMNRYGEIDKNITFKWCEIDSGDEKAIAEVQSLTTNSIVSLADRNIISQEEARQALVNEKDGMFSFIDADVLPEPKEEGNADYLDMLGGL